MLIPVNQNIDEYKDDFYKGLTLRQSVISLVTVAVGVVVYLALTGLLHLPQTLTLYLTLPVVFPIAAYGFLKIHGMNIAEYLRKSGAAKERSAYSFIPQMLMYDAAAVEDNNTSGMAAVKAAGSAADKGTRKGKVQKKTAQMYLETENTISAAFTQGKEEMQLNERNEGIPGADGEAV